MFVIKSSIGSSQHFILCSAVHIPSPSCCFWERLMLIGLAQLSLIYYLDFSCFFKCESVQQQKREVFLQRLCYCICIAKCVLFLLLCSISTFSCSSLIRALLTGWSSVSLSQFLCLCSLLLLSFRHYQTKAYFKTFWKRYISLIPYAPLCFVFCLHCLVWFFHLHQTIDLFHVVHLAVFMFCAAQFYVNLN